MRSIDLRNNSHVAFTDYSKFLWDEIKYLENLILGSVSFGVEDRFYGVVLSGCHFRIAGGLEEDFNGIEEGYILIHNPVKKITHYGYVPDQNIGGLGQARGSFLEVDGDWDGLANINNVEVTDGSSYKAYSLKKFKLNETNSGTGDKVEINRLLNFWKPVTFYNSSGTIGDGSNAIFKMGDYTMEFSNHGSRFDVGKILGKNGFRLSRSFIVIDVLSSRLNSGGFAMTASTTIEIYGGMADGTIKMVQPGEASYNRIEKYAHVTLQQVFGS